MYCSFISVYILYLLMLVIFNLVVDDLYVMFSCKVSASQVAKGLALRYAASSVGGCGAHGVTNRICVCVAQGAAWGFMFVDWFIKQGAIQLSAVRNIAINAHGVARVLAERRRKRYRR